jgi:hypothetical protein
MPHARTLTPPSPWPAAHPHHRRPGLPTVAAGRPSRRRRVRNPRPGVQPRARRRLRPGTAPVFQLWGISSQHAVRRPRRAVGRRVGSSRPPLVSGSRPGTHGSPADVAPHPDPVRDSRRRRHRHRFRRVARRGKPVQSAELPPRGAVPARSREYAFAVPLIPSVPNSRPPGLGGAHDASRSVLSVGSGRCGSTRIRRAGREDPHAGSGISGATWRIHHGPDIRHARDSSNSRT